MKKRSKFLAVMLTAAVAASSFIGFSVFAAEEEETRTIVDATGGCRLIANSGIPSSN